ncbi:hypothetical protein CHELA1G11_13700 [Hyphomicrobiales bacterium]|nr:hypothetical protein CHELA1G2_10615 [Hyphomicrobiales bacterium]CAH1673430.1 hypothetical protein CHELA1G11_13700 [Hyphomicrobiales bacterium]
MDALSELAPRYRKQRFNPPEAAEYLLEVHGVSVAHATLNKLRSVGGGPQFQKFGRAVLYQRDALDTWAIERLGNPLCNTAG